MSSSPESRWASLLPYLAVVGMLVAAIAMRDQLESPRAAPEAIERYLRRELDARVGKVLEWEHGRRTRIEAIADEPALRRQLSTEPRTEVLERMLGRLCEDLEGCTLSRPDGALLASHHGVAIPSELVRQAARGRTVQSPLVSTDGPRDGRYAVYFAAPVLEEGTVRAVLTGRVHPDEELGPLLGHQPPGRTGETYAVDPRGYLVTSSRFEPGVQRPARVSRVLADADKWRHPFEPAVPTRSGVDVDGYHDYRGVRVVGAWRWIDELGAGVVTEMDASEAYDLLASR